EVSAATLRRAHAVHPIAAVQSEYSLWSREGEIAVLQACRELGAALVAFSPLGRAFVAGGPSEPVRLGEAARRRRMPRFQADAFARSQALRAPLRRMARDLGCTPGQLALAWLLHQGDDIIPIPGTTRLPHLAENLGAVGVRLDAATCDQLARLFDRGLVSGERYGAATQSEIDTEQFPAS